MDSRKGVYLLLPFFVAFAIFAGGMLYADVDVVAEGGKVSTVDLAALKAELKREIKAELAAERAPAPVSKPFGEAPREESALMDGLFKGVTVGGFIDVNYMYNLRNHGEGRRTGRGTGWMGQTFENSNNGLNFLGENEDNSFTLENFAMFMDKEATDEHPVGWQMHTYWGEKAKAITFLGEDNDPSDDIRFAVATANITWNAPVAGRTVPITMGKMYTWIGYELVENIGNPNYSHGSSYNNAIPFTHMGLSFDVSEFLPSDKWGLTLYYVNGWDSYIDNNEAKSFGTYLTWQPNDDFFISLATIYGAEGWGGMPNGDATMMYDIVATYSLPQVEKLSLGFNWDHGYSEEDGVTVLGNSATSGAHWYAAVGYAMWDFTDKQMGALRYEYFDNTDGAKDANITYNSEEESAQVGGGSWYTITYTHNITVSENLMLRPEIRYNNYSSTVRPDLQGAAFEPGDKGNTADDEIILTFGAEYMF
jgi:hypothetical protein